LLFLTIRLIIIVQVGGITLNLIKELMSGSITNVTNPETGLIEGQINHAPTALMVRAAKTIQQLSDLSQQWQIIAMNLQKQLNESLHQAQQQTSDVGSGNGRVQDRAGNNLTQPGDSTQSPSTGSGTD
jgi:DNA-binding transcriptional MerR regulator